MKCNPRVPNGNTGNVERPGTMVCSHLAINGHTSANNHTPKTAFEKTGFRALRCFFACESNQCSQNPGLANQFLATPRGQLNCTAPLLTVPRIAIAIASACHRKLVNRNAFVTLGCLFYGSLMLWCLARSGTSKIQRRRSIGKDNSP